MTTRLFKGLITAIIASVAAMSTVMCADAYELEKHTQSEIKKMYPDIPAAADIFPARPGRPAASDIFP